MYARRWGLASHGPGIAFILHEQRVEHQVEDANGFSQLPCLSRGLPIGMNMRILSVGGLPEKAQQPAGEQVHGRYPQQENRAGKLRQQSGESRTRRPGRDLEPGRRGEHLRADTGRRVRGPDTQRRAQQRPFAASRHREQHGPRAQQAGQSQRSGLQGRAEPGDGQGPGQRAQTTAAAPPTVLLRPLCLPGPGRRAPAARGGPDREGDSATEGAGHLVGDAAEPGRVPGRPSLRGEVQP